MSHQYYDRGGPPQDYDYAPPQGQRRPPPQQRDPYGPDPRSDPRRPRGPPMRPPHPGAGAPRGPPVRPPPPQQYSRPPPMEHDESLYDGSAYGGADEYGQDASWPLPAPAPAFAQQSRPRSPQSPGGGSPGGSRGQRRPPQRPQRPDYQEPIVDQPRSGGRPPPDPRAYQQQQYQPPPDSHYQQRGPPPDSRAYQQQQPTPDSRYQQRGPPPPQSHHGDGQWNGEGYSSPPQNYPPQSFQRPPREPQPPVIPDFPTPQQQQAINRQPNHRPPLGPPPSARRGPASYYPQIAPVHPIVEETDSYRGSIRNVSTIAPSHSSYASSNAIPIGIPDYYLEERNSMLPPKPEFQPEYQPQYAGDESPIDYSVDDGRDSRNTERTGPSPDPAAFVRQASLGKKSKPTLTNVKSGERVRKEPMPTGIGSLPSQQQQVQQRALVGGPPSDAAPVKEKDLWPPRVGPPARPSYEDDDDYRPDSYDSSAMPAGLSIAGASNAYPDDLLRKPSMKRRSSDILSSGTGLMDASESSEESEKDIGRPQPVAQPPRLREPERSINRVPSKELLSVSAALTKEQQHRPRSRSPLAPDVDPRVERIVGGLEKGGALTAEEAEQLKLEQSASLQSASAGLSDRANRRRPPKLEMDKVRDAEARGSLTSLPDLIRRATKVASNLDRGKTASRLGMGFFENSSQSDVERMKALDRANRRSGGSGMSEMLSSFPPPQHGDMRRWSSNLRHNALPSTSDAGGEGQRKKGRRCCGMPLWLFLLLLVLLLCLVAAAVIVPVVLVVLPNQNDSSSVMKRCEAQLTCRNGGVAITDADVAGDDNSDGSSSGNNESNAGNGGGGGDCRCLCVAGYTGQTCDTYAPTACTTTTVDERDDVTVGNGIPPALEGAGGFGLQLDGQVLLGLFSRENMSCQAQNALVTFSAGRNQQRDIAAFLPTITINRRQQSGQPAAATSNGLLVQGSSSTTASSPSSPSATSTSSSSPNSESATSNIERESFAGVAVLYLFQSTFDLSAASAAQANLQNFFSGRLSSTITASAVPLGGGWQADLEGLRLRSGNGTEVSGGSA